MPIAENYLNHLRIVHPAAVEVLMLNGMMHTNEIKIRVFLSMTVKFDLNDEHIQLCCCDVELDELPCNVVDAISSQDVES